MLLFRDCRDTICRSEDVNSRLVPAIPVSLNEQYAVGVGIRTTTPYRVYGVRVCSEFPLALPTDSSPGLMKISLREGAAEDFSRARAVAELHRQRWCEYAQLPDGGTYAHWFNLGQFLVAPDGRSIL